MTTQTLYKLLLTWYTSHGRHDLPWRQEISPYRVWLSEIMLQQTQVKTVIPYFLKFLSRFPNIEELANAHEDDVLHLWAGLGYYTRARNLHKCAKIIVSQYQSKFPDDIAELIKLPGIGRSTAGAILSLAFDQRAAILDGNVKRVLSRIHKISYSENKNFDDVLWEFAESHLPNKDYHDYTQAIMDLGAMICTRSKPHCDICPLQKICGAYQTENPANYPGKKAKKSIPTKTITLMIIHHNNKILLEKRPSSGIWGGLWSLPEMAYDKDAKSSEELYSPEFIFEKNLEMITHTFTHFHLQMYPIIFSLSQQNYAINELQCWYDLQNPQKIGLPAPIKKLLDSLGENIHDKNDILSKTAKRKRRLSATTISG